MSCVIGVSRWTEDVPGMRWRKVEALEFRAVALTVSMVIRVMLLRVSPSMRWTKVEPRAVLIWSRREMMEDGSGVPSRLMRSLLSLRVGAFLSCGGDGLLVLGAGAVGACVFVVDGVFFFFGFFATVAQVGAGTAGVGLEGGGTVGARAEVDSGFGAG